MKTEAYHGDPMPYVFTHVFVVHHFLQQDCENIIASAHPLFSSHKF